MRHTQTDFPNCFLTRSPERLDEALNSWSRIHSAFPEEFFLHRTEGIVHQYVFCDKIVAGRLFELMVW